MKEDDSGPAFPATAGNQVYCAGMTLRQYYAGLAMQALIEKLNINGLYREQVAGESIELGKAAYLIADAMIEAGKQ